MKFCLMSTEDKIKARAGWKIGMILNGGDPEKEINMDHRFRCGEWGDKSPLGVFALVEDIVEKAQKGIEG